MLIGLFQVLFLQDWSFFKQILFFTFSPKQKQQLYVPYFLISTWSYCCCTTFMIFSQCSSCKYARTWQSRAFSVISMYKICILYIWQWNRKTYITRVSQNTHAVCTEHCQRSTCCTADASSTLQLVTGAFIVTYSSSHHYGRRNNKSTNQWAHVCTPGLLRHQGGTQA